MRVGLVEQRAREVVGLQQTADLHQRRRIGHRLTPQVDADEVTQCLAVVQRVFQRLVGQAVPLLETVHAQHFRHADRRAAHAATLSVQRLDHGDQPRPRHDALHVGEELLAPRVRLLHRVLGAGKTALAHATMAPALPGQHHRGLPG